MDHAHELLAPVQWYTDTAKSLVCYVRLDLCKRLALELP
jgi:hypothetical protein